MKKYFTLSLTIFILSLSTFVFAQEQMLDLDDKNSVRGIVASENVALLSVDLSAKVNKIPFRVGESFKKDQTLLSFDCVVKKAEASAAYASFQAAKVEYNSNLELQRNSAVGDLEVELSKAKMNEGQAMWAAAKGRTKNCVIKAPFDGKVAALSVNEHEISTPDKPIMKIVGNSNLELRLIVPSSWLSWIKADAPFTFQIDETGKEYLVSVTRIGAEIDAVSGTIEIFGKFAEEFADVLPGMSGLARFSDVEKFADVSE